jgi:hypothetical protein
MWLSRLIHFPHMHEGYLLYTTCLVTHILDSSSATPPLSVMTERFTVLLFCRALG